MLLATVMTIVLSVSFKSVTDTQVTKLEEESQKALAAAESAIEVALKENSSDSSKTTIALSSISGISGFSGNATIEKLSGQTFTTSSILKDGSYTFYLGNYNLTTKAIESSYNQDVILCFQGGGTNPAIEATLVKSNGVTKYVVDPSSRITNASNGLPVSSSCPSGYTYSTTITGDANSQFLLVRVLYASTKLFFYSSSNLPVQGRTVSSQATSSTSTGVSKKVVLFQSYPQIPAEFFTTAF